MKNLKPFSTLEKTIEYSFKDISILENAMNHSSYANEAREEYFKNNERMEFLGDAVLEFISSEYLFKKFEKDTEGSLSKIRASLVCEGSLSAFAKEIDLGSYIFLGRGEEEHGGRERTSILENTFECLIAAIFLDGGIEQAKKFVLKFLDREKNFEVEKNTVKNDYKTRLQEIVQQNPGDHVRYSHINTEGPPHCPIFSCVVMLESNVIGSGKGHSKKEAEQNAAKDALTLMGVI